MFQDVSRWHIVTVAVQVAAVSGDVRRALELCRKAAEIAEEQQQSCTAAASPTGDCPSIVILPNLTANFLHSSLVSVHSSKALEGLDYLPRDSWL